MRCQLSRRSAPFVIDHAADSVEMVLFCGRASRIPVAHIMRICLLRDGDQFTRI